MKILFLATWFPYPSDSGSKLRVYHLLRALGQAHEVTLLSFAFDTARPDEPGQLRLWCRDIQVVPIDPFAVNQEAMLRTFLSARPMSSRPIPAMSQLVADVLRPNAFDVVIASTEMMADYALQISPGAVKILEEHNSMTRWMKNRFEGAKHPLMRARYWASWQKRRRFEARYYRHFNLITMVSEADRTTTTATLGKHRARIETVPNGVDCQHNQPGLAHPEPDTLVFNGSLTYSANYDAARYFLRDIFPLIRQQRPHVQMTITGSLTGVNTTGLALDDSVNLTGFVEDVRFPVAQAAVCVVPLRDGGGTRLKILEAMALGTPVVATSKGAEGLDVTDGEHLLLADTPEAFARCTVELLGNPALRRDLAANARRLVEKRYDWKAIGQRFADLVEATVRQRRGQKQ